MINLKYLPRKTIILLLNEVFDQLPTVLAEVAPNGWDEGPYYPLFHYSKEEKLLQELFFRVSKAQYEQRFGALRHLYTGNTPAEEDITLEALLKNFEYTHQPKPSHPEKELCSLFVDALSMLTSGGKFTREDDQFLYEVNPPVVHSAAEIVARDKGITTEKPFRLPFIHWEKRFLITEANLIPLMRYLFRALPKTDFHWEYVDSEALEFIEFCDKHRAGKIDNSAPYYASEKDFKLGITSLPTPDDYFEEANKELPDDAVVAYDDVFGAWPKGFPLDKDYYLEWYKKLTSNK